jgi:hypothetical protein
MHNYRVKSGIHSKILDSKIKEKITSPAPPVSFSLILAPTKYTKTRVHLNEKPNKLYM